MFTYFRRWPLDGTLRRAYAQLRALAREGEGRKTEPSDEIIDSQSVRATGVSGLARGYSREATAGRRRSVLIDAAGLILLAHVHAADLHDRIGAKRLVERVGEGKLPCLNLVWAKGAYADWLEAERSWQVEVPKRRDRYLWRYSLGVQGYASDAVELAGRPAPVGMIEQLSSGCRSRASWRATMGAALKQARP